ncbi:MAG TPA: PEP-CTERM sorting domain-containing protein [Burkholderiaceae bacterium]|nr:PEP-CTERM sorting domain-containing protein [Burkholderiaceae bacterium]
MNRLLSGFALSACLLALPVLAHAAPLPDATIIGDVLLNKGGRQDLNTFGSIGIGGPGFGADLTVSGTPLPTISAAAQTGPSGDIPGLFSRADAVLTYAFEIFGPADSVPVIIDVAGIAQGDASAGASFAVASLWQLFDSAAAQSTVLASDEIRSGQLSGRFSESFGRSVSLTLLTNHIYPIFLLADAAAAATDTGSRAVASAFVDPRLSFGAGVDPGVFSFAFSAGIGNELPPPTTSVPEPTTAGLLGAAALVAGWLRRRGRVCRPDASQ